jgi:hypothetical protein
MPVSLMVGCNDHWIRAIATQEREYNVVRQEDRMKSQTLRACGRWQLPEASDTALTVFRHHPSSQ